MSYDFTQDEMQSEPLVRCIELFDRCVVRTSGDGWHEIKCRLGLWGVTGPSRELVEGEAMHYWQQYYADGEYQKHLSNVKLTDGGPKTP